MFYNMLLFLLHVKVGILVNKSYFAGKSKIFKNSFIELGSYWLLGDNGIFVEFVSIY